MIEKTLHLMVTTLCLRNCKYCCNKQYNLNDIPYVTDKELKECNILCITGGEPFAFMNPDDIAFYYRKKYNNIKKIYVYTNALELLRYIENHYQEGQYINNIDGLSISIKTETDKKAFEKIINHPYLRKTTENRLYIFDNLFPKCDYKNFNVIERKWQKVFIPADNSIFRKI